MTRRLVITNHARDRWLERVQRGASPATADETILLMCESGRRTEKPPRWLRQGGVRAGPATTFVLWERLPGVALVLREGRVVTVMTREGGEPWRQEQRTRRRCDRPKERRPRAF